MIRYGQFCSISKALEVVGERWTPLILRELICGSTRFSEIHRGVPRMSPALLTKRLTDLVEAGVLRRIKGGGYELTEAGRELKPVVEALGVWGQRWVRGQLTEADFDPDLLMWDIRRRLDTTAFPDGRACICFIFRDTPEGDRQYWLLGSGDGVDLCIADPGHEVDLYVTTDVRTLTLVWNGDMPLAGKIGDGSIDLHGSGEMRAAFSAAMLLGLFAGVPPAPAG